MMIASVLLYGSLTLIFNGAWALTAHSLPGIVFSLFALALAYLAQLSFSTDREWLGYIAWFGCVVASAIAAIANLITGF